MAAWAAERVRTLCWRSGASMVCSSRRVAVGCVLPGARVDWAVGKDVL